VANEWESLKKVVTGVAALNRQLGYSTKQPVTLSELCKNSG